MAKWGVVVDDEWDELYRGDDCVADCVKSGIANEIARKLNAFDEMLASLKTLAADVQQYEAWQRPCYALDKAIAAITSAEAAHV